jgi:hypothetical protein
MRTTALAVSLCLLAGCAAQRREAFAKERAAEHVYQRPLEELWPVAKQLLKDEGYSWKEIPGQYVLATEWREEGGGAVVSYTRYLVEGKKVTDAGSIIRFTKSTKSTQGTPTESFGGGAPKQTQEGPNSNMLSMANSAQGQQGPLNQGVTGAVQGTRDLTMEWQLLKRTDAARAAEIEGQALKEFP